MHPNQVVGVGAFPPSPLPATGLQSFNGKTLALVGGDVTVNGGIVSALNGRIELGAVRSGVVGLHFSEARLALSYEAATFKDIQLLNRSLLNVFGSHPDSIQIQGNQIQIKDGSLVRIQNFGPHSDSRLSVRAAESLTLNGEIPERTTPASFVTEAMGTGGGAGIEILTQRFQLTNNSAIATFNYGSGRGGNITIDAAESAEISGIPPFDFPSIIGISTLTFGQGPGGSINLSTPRLAIDAGAAVLSATLGRGQGGNLNFSTGQLTLKDGGGIISTALGQGRGGNITISTGQLTARDGGGIGTSTLSTAPGGDLKIDAVERLEILGFSLTPETTTSVFPNASNAPSTLGTTAVASGHAGNVEIFSPYLRAEEGGQIGTVTFGAGQGGNVRVSSHYIEIRGATPEFVSSLINSATYGSGDAGNIAINTEILKVLDGGGVTSLTLGSGKAGTIAINAVNSLEVSGFANNTLSRIDSSASAPDRRSQDFFGLPPVPSGRAGNISIRTGQLFVSERGTINVSNEGIGSGGNIDIVAPTLVLERNGRLSASTQSEEGGNISLTSQDIRLFDSQISASAGETGNGGNITINTDFLTLSNNSQIDASAVEGQGGRIDITARGLFISPDSSISASSQLGANGIVQLNIDPFQIISNDTGLPVAASNLEDLLTQTCEVLAKRRQARFTQQGRGGTVMSALSAYSLEDLAPSGQVFGFIKRGDGTVRLLSCDRLDN